MAARLIPPVMISEADPYVVYAEAETETPPPAPEDALNDLKSISYHIEQIAI